MIIAGIDPGKTGAMVLVFPDNSVTVHRVPLTKKGSKTVPAYTEWGRSWFGLEAPDMFVIEQVASRPGQGSASGFNFGRSYGFAHALAVMQGAPIHFVTPSVWKAKMGLVNVDKNGSREMARQLLPSITNEVKRVMDDGVAEAALLALYARKVGL